MPTASEDYRRIAAAINFIAENRLEQPELAAVAAAVGLSKYHFQRLFVRWTGISPKQFLAHLTVGHAKELLRQGESVLHASLDTGLSGPGRLHDLFVGVEAMTPGDYNVDTLEHELQQEQRIDAGVVHVGRRRRNLVDSLGDLLFAQDLSRYFPDSIRIVANRRRTRPPMEGILLCGHSAAPI